METEGLRCDQLVTIDSCCTPTVCSEPASHTHEASALSLQVRRHRGVGRAGFDQHHRHAEGAPGKQQPVHMIGAKPAPSLITSIRWPLRRPTPPPARQRPGAG